jgi:signal transduction histidine kinase
VVVPSYERSLVDTRLRDVQSALRTIVAAPPTADMWSHQWTVEEAAPIANARVIVFQHLERGLEPYSDSSPPGGSSRDVENDPVATRALESVGYVRGSVTRGGQRFAEAAYSYSAEGPVVMVSSPLHNDLVSVGVVRKRVIVAGALATAFAIVLGYVLALLFARRIRRLDRAAARIADGRFDEPVIDPAPDELGQLARTFERMRQRLASLDRARAEFIANASHELRTPLHSLAGFLELLASEDLDAETRADFMTAIRDQVSRLTKLATDLLDLSRMDAGRLSVESESLDLAPLGELLASEFGPRAGGTGHVVDLDVAGSAPALGDEQRVLQIGRILVENAIVHTPPGTVVRVSAGASRGGPSLSIVDNGPGIPPEAQEHVFDRFYRLEGSRASGSGLGLAIARELAGLMNGRLELESAAGVTRFTLVLPADAGDRVREPSLA